MRLLSSLFSRGDRQDQPRSSQPHRPFIEQLEGRELFSVSAGQEAAPVPANRSAIRVSHHQRQRFSQAESGVASHNLRQRGRETLGDLRNRLRNNNDFGFGRSGFGNKPIFFGRELPFTDFGGFYGIGTNTIIGSLGYGAPGFGTGFAATFNAFGPRPLGLLT